MSPVVISSVQSSVAQYGLRNPKSNCVLQHCLKLGVTTKLHERY